MAAAAAGVLPDPSLQMVDKNPADVLCKRSAIMCGIVGYIGAKKATPILIEALKRLEYRGYDSAGVAVLSEESLHVCKATHRSGSARHRHTPRRTCATS